MNSRPDVLVVGAGFAGATCARELADNGFTVLVIDKRKHIAGNAYDEFDSWGVLIHRYGPHLFHTNSDRVSEWLSKFTKWRSYEHRVLAYVCEKLLPIPINRTTINALYGLQLQEADVETFLQSVREERNTIVSSEDVVLSSVGRDLCDKFFRGYTKKQWGIDLSELSAGVAARIPTRTNDDDRYFTDRFQAMPLDGYSSMFRRMLSHPNISVQLEVEYTHIKGDITPRHTVFTGPIDAYFDYRFGKLPYRSLRFEHEHFPDIEAFQPVGTINYPNDHLYTRITEFKHATGQVHTGTSIVREYPQPHGDAYYPIPTKQNEEMYQLYKHEAAKLRDVTFVGRLAQYRYYNMDQVVAAALKSATEIKDAIRPVPTLIGGKPISD